MSRLDVFAGARRLLASEESWCQGAYALTSAGVVTANPCRAVRFSLRAAVDRAAMDLDVGADMAAAWANECGLVLTRAIGPEQWDLWGDTKAAWNDAPIRTHAQVLALLDRVIAREAGQGELFAEGM